MKIALHAHFLLPAWRKDGQAISKVLTWKSTSAIHDVALSAIQTFAPKIERGKRRSQRLKEGDKPSDVINKYVKKLHQELPDDIAKKQAELDALLEKFATNEARVAKLREWEELTAKEQKRLEAHERRAANAKWQIKAIEHEMDLSMKLLDWGSQTIDEQKLKWMNSKLRKNECKMRCHLQIMDWRTSNGHYQFNLTQWMRH